MTRTHTHYFSPDSGLIHDLHEARMALWGDFDERSEVLDLTSAETVKRRLIILDIAIELLTERVAE